jgi:predicted metalloprotease
VNTSEFAEDVDAAEQITDQFWQTHWSEFFTGEYSPPTVVGLYDGNSPDAPYCGPDRLPPGNAFYCHPDDFVAWDVGLLATGFEYGGDSWVYLVIAHEWAHAIQADLDMSLQSVSAELQADCLAAATLYGAALDGILAFDEGDEKELVGALTSLADETAWTTSSDHGDAFERVEQFNRGRQSGVSGCLPTS